MLDLPNVTLLSLTGIDFPGHKKAFEKSQEYINFGAAKIIWDDKIKSVDEWCRKVVFDLGDYIETDYALLIHADGYVIHPELWNPDWLEYDYIGAPWPLPTDDFSFRDVNGVIQRVGNSVSLRSRKLMQLPKKMGMEWKPFHGYYHEDGYIGVNMRHVFEQNGCKIAPLDVAKYFSKEHEIPENKDITTFVFHSI